MPSRLIASLARIAGLAALGALVGAVALAAAFGARSSLTLEMDQDPLPLLSGFWPPEIDGGTTFQWTKGRAEITLAGLNRREAWQCAIRLRGGRPAGVPDPIVDLAVDGVTERSVTAAGGYQDAAVLVPASPQAGVRLMIATTPTFSAPPDPRQLGVQIDSVTCRPAGGGLARPPTSELRDAAAAGAAWGAAIGVLGLGAGAALAVVGVVAAVQALPLAAGAAPYLPYAASAPWMAFWIGAAMIAIGRAPGARARGGLTQAARFVVAFSGAALYLKLLALLHPAKVFEDAIFHAHNFEKVLDGRFFLAQPMPGGVQFPYAIALYAAAAPWAALAHSTVARMELLRILVCSADVVAGACLYWMIVRAWNDRLAGVVAVVLYQLLPVSYGMQGNANLTNMFGQSVALVAVAAATVWSFQPYWMIQTAALTVIAAVAFLSHVSVVGSLLPTLLALAVLYRWRKPGLKPQAAAIATATAAAAVVAVVLFYGRWDHFGDAYRSLRLTRAAVPTVAPTAGVLKLQASSRPVLALEQLAGDLGWPILAMALAGAWRLWAARRSDRLVLSLVAWAAALAALLIVGVLSPTSASYLRYTLEFISRADAACAPAAMILAGAAFAWAWRAGPATRLAALGLGVWAACISVPFWSAWFQ